MKLGRFWAVLGWATNHVTKKNEGPHQPARVLRVLTGIRNPQRNLQRGGGRKLKKEKMLKGEGVTDLCGDRGETVSPEKKPTKRKKREGRDTANPRRKEREEKRKKQGLLPGGVMRERAMLKLPYKARSGRRT